MKRLDRIRPLLLAIVLFSLIGCNGSDGGDDSPSPLNVTGSWISPKFGYVVNLQQDGATLTGTEDFSGNTHKVSGSIFDGNAVSFTSYYPSGTKYYSGEASANSMNVTVVVYNSTTKDTTVFQDTLTRI